MYPPQSPTRTTNNSILKLAGAFHWPNTSRIRFWAFSYSAGEPCGRSNQLIMYFISSPLRSEQLDLEVGWRLPLAKHIQDSLLGILILRRRTLRAFEPTDHVLHLFSLKI